MFLSHIISQFSFSDHSSLSIALMALVVLNGLGIIIGVVKALKADK